MVGPLMDRVVDNGEESGDAAESVVKRQRVEEWMIW